MMLDWAASLLVVSLIVFGLVVVSFAFFQTADTNDVLRASLSSTSHTVSDEVDRLEATTSEISEEFQYQNQSYQVPMPGLLAGVPYTVDFTHDYVVTVSNGSGPILGAYLPLTSPVHLLPKNMTLQLGGPYPISGYHLHSLDTTYDCQAFPSGTDFTATEEAITVDGLTTYQTFVYATNGLYYPCS